MLYVAREVVDNSDLGNVLAFTKGTKIEVIEILKIALGNHRRVLNFLSSKLLWCTESSNCAPASYCYCTYGSRYRRTLKHSRGGCSGLKKY